jgi:hypothetical protein
MFGQKCEFYFGEFTRGNVMLYWPVNQSNAMLEPLSATHASLSIQGFVCILFQVIFHTG